MFVRTSLPSDSILARQQVLQEVRQIVADVSMLSLDEILEDQDLQDDCGCDSLEVVEIVMQIEDHFRITVPEGTEHTSRTVRALVDGVLRLLRSAEAPASQGLEGSGVRRASPR